MDVKQILGEGLDWNHWAEDRAQCFAVVNTVMKLRFYKMGGGGGGNFFFFFFARCGVVSFSISAMLY
jgi:hypothetical protein